MAPYGNPYSPTSMTERGLVLFLPVVMTVVDVVCCSCRPVFGRSNLVQSHARQKNVPGFQDSFLQAPPH